jgi:hypothetical protein
MPRIKLNTIIRLAVTLQRNCRSVLPWEAYIHSVVMVTERTMPMKQNALKMGTTSSHLFPKRTMTKRSATTKSPIIIGKVRREMIPTVLR